MLETNNNQELKINRRKKLRRKLDAIGWGIFFIWVGIALLADVGWGVGCIGVGVIILPACSQGIPFRLNLLGNNQSQLLEKIFV